MNELVNHQVVGKEQDPTIYYMSPYSVRIGQLWPHIGALALFGGFRIKVFDYDPAVLNGGNPQLLIDALGEVTNEVKKDKQSREVAGVYGISLGSLFGLNVLALDGIKRGMFNTGGVNTAKAVWTAESRAPERQAFKKNGYDQESVNAVWAPYDISTDGSKLKGKKILVTDSTADEVIPIADARMHIKAWQAQGVDARLITINHTRHVASAVRNALHLGRTIKFFKK